MSQARAQPCVVVRIDKHMAEFFAALSQSTAGFDKSRIDRATSARERRTDATEFSDFLGVEDQQVGAAAGELRHVACRGLARFAAESRLDVGHAVEGEDCDEVDAGRPGSPARRVLP